MAVTIRQVLNAIKNQESLFHIWELYYHKSCRPSCVMVAGDIPISLVATVTFTRKGASKRYHINFSTSGNTPLTLDALYLSEEEAKQDGIEVIRNYFWEGGSKK